MEDEPWDSGMAEYALVLSRELESRGHRVLFWGRPGCFPCRKARVWGLETVEARPWLGLPGLRRLLRRERVQVVNAHTGSSHSLAAIAAAGLKIALIRTRADARPPKGGGAARFLASRTAAYIAVNCVIEKDLAARFPGARVRLVPQGLPEPSTRHPLAEEPAVGLLGRLDPVKGHADFLEAAALLRKRFPAARFLAAGGGGEDALARLSAQRDRLGLRGAAELPGFVRSSENFMGSCRIGVVASHGSEAVSRAALEWMAQGRPLVATEVGGLPDLVEDGKTGFLACPRSPSGLASAIGLLLADPVMAAEFGKNARARYEKFYGSPRFAAETEKVYEEALHHLPS